MSRVKYILSVVVFVVLIIFFVTDSVFASFFLDENFGDGKLLSSDYWDVYPSSESIEYSDNFATFSQTSSQLFPYVVNREPFSVNEDVIFSVEYMFRYSDEYYNYGSGIALSEEMYSYRTSIQPSLDDVLFNMWVSPGRIFQLNTKICPESNYGCTDTQTVFRNDFTSDWTNIKIVYDKDVYRVYLNDELIYTTVSTSRSPKYLWLGNPQQTTSNVIFSKFDIKRISINTAKAISMKPIILIPGLGASWNLEYILTGKESGVWKPTPYVNVYDNLISSINQSDEYELGENFFVYYYNWTKPVTDIADQFSAYVDSEVLTGDYADSKVTLVGHSLGGLVAREYWQTGSESKVDRILTVGSPHRGVVDGYFLWEGGVPLRNDSWEGLGLDLLRVIHLPRYLSGVDLVRDLVPIAKDLMPVFDYAYSGNTVMPVTTMSQYNAWLADRNNRLPSGGPDNFTQLVGSGSDTPISVSLEPQSWYDRLVGKWADGVPVSVGYTNAGDGAVASLSATLAGVDTMLADRSNHGEIIMSQLNVGRILDYLGLDTPVVQEANRVERNPALVVLAHSPVAVTVCDPAGRCVGHGVDNQIPLATYSSEDKLIVIPQSLNGSYEIKLLGTGTGLYQIEVGHLANEGDSWDRINGKIEAGQNIVHMVQHRNDGTVSTMVELGTIEQNLTTARVILVELKSRILPSLTDNARFTRLFGRYIDRAIRNIDRALGEYRAGRPVRAAKYAQMADKMLIRLMTYAYRYGERYGVKTEVILELRNRALETLPYLEQAWQDTLTESGKNYSSRRVGRYYRRFAKNYERYEAKLAGLTDLEPKHDLVLANFPETRGAAESARTMLDGGENTGAFVRIYNGYLLVRDSEYILR